MVGGGRGVAVAAVLSYAVQFEAADARREREGLPFRTTTSASEVVKKTSLSSKDSVVGEQTRSICTEVDKGKLYIGRRLISSSVQYRLKTSGFNDSTSALRW